MNRPAWMLEDARRFDHARRRARLRQINWPVIGATAMALACAWVIA